MFPDASPYNHPSALLPRTSFRTPFCPMSLSLLPPTWTLEKGHAPMVGQVFPWLKMRIFLKTGYVNHPQNLKDTTLLPPPQQQQQPVQLHLPLCLPDWLLLLLRQQARPAYLLLLQLEEMLQLPPPMQQQQQQQQPLLRHATGGLN